MFTFYFFLLTLSAVSVSLYSVAVGCCCILGDGLVLSFVSMSAFHQIGMIAS
jgi:hypothetical protein